MIFLSATVGPLTRVPVTQSLAPAAAKAFAKEFLDGKHSKWSHVYVPAGIANDTNGTESHNHQIKAGGTGWQLQ